MAIDDRIKRVDLDKMDEETFTQLTENLGKKVADKLLNIYGLEVVYNYKIRKKLIVINKE